MLYPAVSQKTLTVAQLAEKLQVSTDTVRRMAREGDIDAFKVRNRWRFTIPAIVALIEKYGPEVPADDQTQP